MNTPDTEMMKLAERCEAATDPNFRLEQEIWAAVVAKPPCPNVGALGQIKPPAYTASLDAAMTLVPEGWFFAVSTHPEGAFAICADSIGGKAQSTERVATPALALCAAALKSRISGDGL